MIAANYVETNKQRASLHLVHFSSLRPYCNIKFFTNGAHRTTAYKSAATTAVGILEAKLKSRTTSDVAGGGGGGGKMACDTYVLVIHILQSSVISVSLFLAACIRLVNSSILLECMPECCILCCMILQKI